MYTSSEITNEERLHNGNMHFRRKCASVINDTDTNAIRLMNEFYDKILININEFNFKTDGLSLAKLTAANLFEIGANVIYITDKGINLIHRINTGNTSIKNNEYTIEHRLYLMNSYFKRKASEVLIDEQSLVLIAYLYENISIERNNFNYKDDSLALSKLTAANFCAIGENNIFITDAGIDFIKSIINNEEYIEYFAHTINS